MVDLDKIYGDFQPNWVGILVVAAVLGISTFLAGILALLPLVRPPAKVQTFDTEHEGLRGWLILVMIGMGTRIYFYAETAVISIGLICNAPKWHLLTDAGSTSYDPGWFSCLFFEACGSEIVIVTGILSFVLMFQKRSIYPYVMIAILLGTIVFHGIDHILASRITGIHHDETQFVTLMARLLFAAVIWVPYFLVSKRVKATFRY